MARQDVADRPALAQRRVERVDGGARHAEGDGETPSRSRTRTAASIALILAIVRSPFQVAVMMTRDLAGGLAVSETIPYPGIMTILMYYIK